ncbi:hypothetical protein C8N32_12312 [Rhodovulum imhoffii]|uniref:Uncharacterized protein n=2 Tax=Rhodovulum imhoffii TaxID=365340 RepID=A0A2T5BP79_9RHOB|nr:hypothetical protein C8N32_12312 [Rhodovulum imhoffii]
MIFAVFMIAFAIATTILMGILVGSIWSALAYAAFLILLYYAATYESGPTRPMKRDQLNAFQRPLSDD